MMHPKKKQSFLSHRATSRCVSSGACPQYTQLSCPACRRYLLKSPYNSIPCHSIPFTHICIYNICRKCMKNRMYRVSRCEGVSRVMWGDMSHVFETRGRVQTSTHISSCHPEHGIGTTNARFCHVDRRNALLCSVATAGGVLWSGIIPLAVQSSELSQRQLLEEVARSAYATRRFDQAIKALDELVRMSPESLEYLEMRADTCVDGKSFAQAIVDYERVLSLMPEESLLDRARIISGMALALEGLDRFDQAAKAYEESLSLASKAGAEEDPYILNSLGNCYSSLGRWNKARELYLKSAHGFQSARSDMGRPGGMQRRLDGSIFAFSNAALMHAQISADDSGSKYNQENDEVIKEMEYIARRAPGSADMRAALAVMYWAREDYDKAETEWEFACNSIRVGCAKYEDIDWLSRVRRWPPVMVGRMKDFLALRSNFGLSGKEYMHS